MKFRETKMGLFKTTRFQNSCFQIGIFKMRFTGASGLCSLRIFMKHGNAFIILPTNYYQHSHEFEGFEGRDNDRSDMKSLV